MNIFCRQCSSASRRAASRRVASRRVARPQDTVHQTQSSASAEEYKSAGANIEILPLEGGRNQPARPKLALSSPLARPEARPISRAPSGASRGHFRPLLAEAGGSSRCSSRSLSSIFCLFWVSLGRLILGPILGLIYRRRRVPNGD